MDPEGLPPFEAMLTKPSETQHLVGYGHVQGEEN